MPHDNEVFELVCFAHTPEKSREPRSPKLLRFVDIKSVSVQRLRIPENLRGLIREQLAPCQDKFRIETVRRGFVDRLAGKISLQSIFEIIVEAGPIDLPIGRKFFLLIHHHEPGTAPWLARLPDISLEKIVFPIKSSSDEIIAGRLVCDRLVQQNLRLGK